MSDEKPEVWPLLPAYSAYALHGLCIALADTVRDELTGTVSRRAVIKASGLATAAELLSQELAHFFGSRPAGDHEELEALEERYLENRLKAEG